MKFNKADIVFLTVTDWCRRNGVEPPVRELVFAKCVGRKFRFDMAWPDRMVAAELNGGNWTGGRHTRGLGHENDCVKLSLAAALGWRVLQATYKHADSGDLLTWLAAALGVTPLPVPP